MKRRPIRYIAGISPQEALKKRHTYAWDSFLKLASSEAVSVLDATLFDKAPLSNYMGVIQPGLKLEVRLTDYDGSKHVYWIATVQRRAGYYLLMRFEGMDKEGDEQNDFWINSGSDDVKRVGYCSTTTPSCVLYPPSDIRERQSNWASYILERVANCKTLASTWLIDRQRALTQGKFEVGMRMELLDRLESTRVRPARVLKRMGQRIYIAISKEDVDVNLSNEQEDIQLEGVWLHESSGLLFPVGWATHNGYGLEGNASYLQHCKALESGDSVYDAIDAKPELFTQWAERNEANTHCWEVGMKFECLDPLNSSFLEMRVATCLQLMKDGYLRIGFDEDANMEEESIPIHCTSPLLFPAGYAEEHSVVLKGPIMDGEEFSWREYLQQAGAIAAPTELFDPLPSPEIMKEKYKIGSKLEAVDQCEPTLICPATLTDVKGRLLRVHFDGWEENLDQLFDYRSCDLFPLGWCDMNGFPLESPKAGDSPPKKSRSSSSKGKKDKKGSKRKRSKRQ